MALYKFNDSAGREAYKDEKGNVYTEGGKRSTGYTVNDWNQRQQNKYGIGQSIASPSTYSPSTNFGSNLSYAQSVYSGGSNSVADALNKAKMRTEETMGKQIGNLEAQRKPLKERYQSLLSQLKTQESVETGRESTETTRELGRRGISTDSGVADELLTERLNPITQRYAGAYQEAGAQNELDLLNLAQQIAGLQTNMGGLISGYDQSIAQELQRKSDEANRMALIDKMIGAQNQDKYGTKEPMPEVPPENPLVNFTKKGDWIWYNNQWIPTTNPQLFSQALLGNTQSSFKQDNIGYGVNDMDPVGKLGQFISNHPYAASAISPLFGLNYLLNK